MRAARMFRTIANALYRQKAQIITVTPDNRSVIRDQFGPGSDADPAPADHNLSA
jgi:hypothetical protein